MSDPAAPSVPVLRLDIGDVVEGKYRVEQVLGAGGMGMVVKATHLRLQEPVALKFILPQVAADPSAVRRFLREAQAAAKIKSEHVVRVFDVGEHASGAPYLVMEYLEGQDLCSVLKSRGALPVVEAVDHVLQVCDALGEAHVLGIVHRDLKPANVFVTRDRERRPCVKILDFGISKIAAHARLAGDEGALTSSAMLIGSPLYMSPEQLKCSRDVDERADIWSLGVMLFELVAGKLPFSASSVAELCANVITAQPPSVRLHRPEVPEAFANVLSRCLQKDASDRYANVGDLAQALAPFGSPGSKAIADSIARIVDSAGMGRTLPATSAPTGSVPGEKGPDTTGTAFADSASQHRSKAAPRVWPYVAVASAVAVAGMILGARFVLRAPAPDAPASPFLKAEGLVSTASSVDAGVSASPSSLAAAPSAAAAVAPTPAGGSRSTKAGAKGANAPPTASAPSTGAQPAPQQTVDLTKSLLPEPERPR
jgi:eukaryotic-like serine/threonine-protein kinase